MNSSLVIICFMVYGIASMGAVLFSYNLGLRNGREIKEDKEISGTVSSKRKVKFTKEEEEKFNKINLALSNIENYDGTSRGQKEIR